MHNLRQGQKVYFLEDARPFKVMATSDRYVIVSRKLCKKYDWNLLQFEVERRASWSLEEAWESNKDLPVYSILDFKENKRNCDDRVFGCFDYFLIEDCISSIADLESGELGISRRGAIDININYNKTLNK